MQMITQISKVFVRKLDLLHKSGYLKKILLFMRILCEHEIEQRGGKKNQSYCASVQPQSEFESLARANSFHFVSRIIVRNSTSKEVRLSYQGQYNVILFLILRKCYFFSRKSDFSCCKQNDHQKTRLFILESHLFL